MKMDIKKAFLMLICLMAGWANDERVSFEMSHFVGLAHEASLRADCQISALRG
jgi:hypothetical protein